MYVFHISFMHQSSLFTVEDEDLKNDWTSCVLIPNHAVADGPNGSVNETEVCGIPLVCSF